MLDMIQKIDEAILFYIQSNVRNPVLDQAMLFITSLGNSGFLWYSIGVILLFYKRYQKCGITLICAVSLGMFLNDDIVKLLINRVRPCIKFPEVTLLLSRPHSPSFPSGHTMVAFAAATVLVYYKRSLGYIAYILAVLIAFSRLYLFVHYPSDILGGILLGTIHSVIIIYGINKIYENIALNRSSFT